MSVQGRLKDMGLLDILQILHAEGRTAGVHLGSELGYGKVYVKAGEVVHVSYRDTTDLEALCNLFAWNDGDFEVEDDEVAPHETFTDDFEVILHDSFVKIEESRGKGLEEAVLGMHDSESAMLVKNLLELGILEKIGV
ncbi:MAG: DUF4388 domain-containing protein [Deltaproteobacteria bacterium]|nr:DUF4388 domain-containing protein [Deltaproteobacteria bacterium]